MLDIVQYETSTGNTDDHTKLWDDHGWADCGERQPGKRYRKQPQNRYLPTSLKLTQDNCWHTR